MSLSLTSAKSLGHGMCHIAWVMNSRELPRTRAIRCQERRLSYRFRMELESMVLHA